MSIGCNICGQSLPDAEPHLCEPMTAAEHEFCGVLCLLKLGAQAPYSATDVATAIEELAKTGVSMQERGSDGYHQDR